MTDFRPGNYSVHYMQQIDALRPTCPPKWMANLQWLNGLIERGQHFHLPDMARLIEVDDMPDYMPLLLRPPFPVTVLEYACSEDVEAIGDLTDAKSSKRIVLAFDSSEGRPPFPVLLHGKEIPARDGVWLVSIFYGDNVGQWVPPSLLTFIPYEQEVKSASAMVVVDSVRQKLGLTPKQIERRKGLGVVYVGLGPDLLEQIDSEYPGKSLAFVEEEMANAQYEHFAFMQLCLVLGCANVSAERQPAAAKLNKARVRSGKRAFFDYHVLTIPGTSGGKGDGASGRTVRTHLRRGHIRRLQSGKIVWVNAALVKGRAKGFVSKSYDVSPSGVSPA